MMVVWLTMYIGQQPPKFDDVISEQPLHYGVVFFHVSWCVQWPQHRICLKKLPKNDASLGKIHLLALQIEWNQFLCQLMYTVTSPVDWPWKTTPKWLFFCQNPSTGSEDRVKSIFSYKSNSTIANVCLSVSFSVCLSQKPLSLSELLLSTMESIDHGAYWPWSLLTIEPIDHRAYQPSSLLTIKPINHQAYQPLSL